MFCIGDQIVHPMHGAGIIDAIVQEKISGNTQEYYVFKMPVSGLLLKIPTANSEVIGIRAIVGFEEAEALLQAMPSITMEETTNWNKRYRENMVRLKSGDLYEVARVIKALMHRDGQRGLSTGERKMLHNAKQILISELVLSEQSDYDAMEARVNCAMMEPADK
ncbi:MAG: CarD family transcriptional regulator [Oscillibacter sp.]